MTGGSTGLVVVICGVKNRACRIERSCGKPASSTITGCPDGTGIERCFMLRVIAWLRSNCSIAVLGVRVGSRVNAQPNSREGTMPARRMHVLNAGTIKNPTTRPAPRRPMMCEA